MSSVGLLGQQFVMQHLYRAIYNLFIHSPTKVTDPTVYAVWWIPRTWRDSLKDRYLSDSLRHREDCVDVVRICANEIRCVSGQSWADIVGVKTGGRHRLIRDPQFLRRFPIRLDNKYVR